MAGRGQVTHLFPPDAADSISVHADVCSDVFLRSFNAGAGNEM
jgi:hypothetical protein